MILIVDDIPLNCLLEKRVMERVCVPRGIDIDTLYSVEEALEYLKTHMPQCIFSCINFPGKTGFDFLKEVKADERLRDIPFVFITAVYAPDIMEEAYSLGAADYIIKPINLDRLLNCLRKILD